VTLAEVRIQSPESRVQNRGRLLDGRLLDFAVGVVRLSGQLRANPALRHLGLQLLRSGTSAGANYQEACGAESRADFVHKLQVVLKELRESLYWLRLIERSGLSRSSLVTPLMAEADELIRMCVRSVVTVKSRS
jgi:four helix bundle protein